MTRSLAAVLACAVAACLPASVEAREWLDVDLFARVPAPGLPEGIAVGLDGLVYVGTSPKDAKPHTRRPSKVFAYASDGSLVREYTIEGQELGDSGYGLLGMAFDADGVLYAVDAKPPRVVTLDPRTGEQREYARFADVPSCNVPGTAGRCSATLGDLEAFPDYPVFAPDGTLYVTDLHQALIWRVPRGGGASEVWFTDPRLETLFGPNGIAFLPGARTLVFALTTESQPLAGAPAGLYTLAIRPDGAPGALSLLWQSRRDDAPDGFAIGASGRYYVALAGTNGLGVVSPDGRELARTQRSAEEVPFDKPASVAFLGQRALVTNHAFITRDSAHYAVLDVFAGERGRALFTPRVRARAAERTAPRLKLRIRPRRVRAGRRTRFRLRVTADRRAVRGALVRFAGRRARTDRRGRATVVARLRRRGVRRARVHAPSFRPGRARVRVMRS